METAISRNAVRRQRIAKGRKNCRYIDCRLDAPPEIDNGNKHKRMKQTNLYSKFYCVTSAINSLCADLFSEFRYVVFISLFFDSHKLSRIMAVAKPIVCFPLSTLYREIYAFSCRYFLSAPKMFNRFCNLRM